MTVAFSCRILACENSSIAWLSHQEVFLIAHGFTDHALSERANERTDTVEQVKVDDLAFFKLLIHKALFNGLIVNRVKWELVEQWLFAEDQVLIMSFSLTWLKNGT